MNSVIMLNHNISYIILLGKSHLIDNYFLLYVFALHLIVRSFKGNRISNQLTFVSYWDLLLIKCFYRLLVIAQITFRIDTLPTLHIIDL